MQTDKAISLIKQEFPGAMVEFKWTDMEPMTGATLARFRRDVKVSVPACTSCELHTRCLAPVPPGGPMLNQFGVLGEAPGQQEDRKGEPFVGPSGKLLRAMLATAGLDPDKGLYFNAVQCWPNDGKGKTHAPHGEHIEACADNRDMALDLLQNPWLILCGSTALKLYRPDLQLGMVQGNVFLWQEKYLVMPIYHPAGILRNTNLKRGVQTALDGFGRMVRGEISWVELGRHTCVRCERYFDRIDEDGVPYCEDHWARYGPSKVAGKVSKKNRQAEWDELPLEGIKRA